MIFLGFIIFIDFTNQDLRATITTKEISQESESSSSVVLPNKSNQSISSNDTGSNSSATLTEPLAPDNNQQNIDVPTLNFSKGTAAFCIDAIVSQKDLQLARERIKGKHQKEKTIREQLKSAKRVTSGVVFGSETTQLGKMVFDFYQANVDRKKDGMIQKMTTDEAKYLKDVESAQKVFEKKSDIETMTISELTHIC